MKTDIPIFYNKTLYYTLFYKNQKGGNCFD